jgi:hypothetical protein
MRLIDADAAKAELLRMGGYQSAADRLDTMPVVEERKHGHWVRHNDIIACSECIFDMCFDENLGELNYCPYCGAKMEGE